MQTRQFITAMLLAVAVFFLWMAVAPFVMPKRTPTSTSPANPTADAKSSQPTTATAPSTQASTANADAAVPATTSARRPPARCCASRPGEETMEVGSVSDAGVYPMQFTVSTTARRSPACSCATTRRPSTATNRIRCSSGRRSGDQARVLLDGTEKIRIESFHADVALDDSAGRSTAPPRTTAQPSSGQRSRTRESPCSRSSKRTRSAPWARRRARRRRARAMRHDVTLTYTLRNLTGQPIEVQVGQFGRPACTTKTSHRLAQDRRGGEHRRRNQNPPQRMHSRKEILKNNRAVDLRMTRARQNCSGFR